MGLLELHCPHRGTSLEFGLIAAPGIRCCYHGWCMDVDGKILDTPGEPPDSTLKDRLYHGAYPVHEYGGEEDRQLLREIARKVVEEAMACCYCVGLVAPAILAGIVAVRSTPASMAGQLLCAALHSTYKPLSDFATRFLLRSGLHSRQRGRRLRCSAKSQPVCGKKSHFSHGTWHIGTRPRRGPPELRLRAQRRSNIHGLCCFRRSMTFSVR